MVDILEQSGANRPKAGAIVTPSATVSPQEMVRPQMEAAKGLQGLGRALDEIGDRVDAASVPAAQAAGLAAVGRDDKGQPTVELKPFAFSRSDAAFNAAARQGLLSLSQMDAARGLQEIAAKYPLDPQGFEAEAKTFVNGLGAGSKELRPLVQQEGQKLLQQHFLSITNKKVAQAQENAKTAVTTQIQDGVNSIYALARQGGTETDEYKQAFERISGLYNQLEQNPAFGFPAERVKSELDRIRSQAIGESTVGEVDRTYTRLGKASAQKFLTDSILNNPKLNLSSAERSTLYNSGLARLQYLDGETKAQVAAHRQVVTTIVDGLKGKINIPDAQIDEAVATATRLGDAESVMKLGAARTVAAIQKAGAGLTDEQAVRIYAGLGSGSTAAPAAPAAVGAAISETANRYGLRPEFLTKMAHIESRFDPNAINGGSKATGLFQFIPSTWRQYGQGQDARDPAANADAAARLTIANRNQLRASIGREPTEGELYLAHQQGAGGAAQLLSNPDARAVDVVGERAVLGNGGTLNMTAGQFAQLWIRKFDGASSTAPAAPAGAGRQMPFTPAQIAANPFLGSAWIQSQVADQKEVIESTTKVAAAISAGIDKGVLPDTTTLAAVMQTAGQFPDQLGRVRDGLVAKMQGFDDAWTALGQPSSAGREAVRVAQARAQGAPILVQQRAEAMKDAYDRGVKALQDTPWEEAARRGWSAGNLPALDFSTPDGLAAGLAARQGVATSISARTGEAQSVLSPNDVADLQGVFRNGSPEQRAIVSQGLGQLPDDQFKIVMENNDTRDSLIGMSRSGDPSKMSTAFGLMDRAQRIDPDSFNKTYGRDIENRLGAWTSRLAYLSPEALAAEVAKENDPAVKKARDELRSQAQEKVKKLTPADVTGYFGSWVPFTGPGSPGRAEDAARLASEYKTEFAETFAAIGDEAKARELTVQRLGRVWAPSALNGGRLTKFAPEKSPAYPPINGSHEWIKQQFDGEVRDFLHGMGAADFDPASYSGADIPGVTDAQTVSSPQATALLSAPRMIVSDARTEAEFNAGRAPSYQIVVQAPNGMFVPLQNAQGVAARFTADPELALAPLRAGAVADLERRRPVQEAQDAYDARQRQKAMNRGWTRKVD